MPFGKKIRVTTQLPPVPGHPEITAVRCFIQVRGVENLPLSIGGVAMPPTARLHLQKIDRGPLIVVRCLPHLPDAFFSYPLCLVLVDHINIGMRCRPQCARLRFLAPLPALPPLPPFAILR